MFTVLLFPPRSLNLHSADLLSETFFKPVISFVDSVAFSKEMLIHPLGRKGDDENKETATGVTSDILFQSLWSYLIICD